METVSSGIIAVPAGVSSTGLYFIQEGFLQVLDGGWAQEIGLAEGGQAVVSGGGILYVCTVSSGGTATVLKSGYAQDITVENGGLYLVSSGGTAHKSLLKSGGTQIVRAADMAAAVTIMDGGVLHVSSGGYARNPVVSLGGIAYAWANALIDGARISGTVEVNENAAANSAVVLEGGTLAVLTGGYAYEAKISSGGTLDISSGGKANFASIYDGGAVWVSAGASCLNAELNGGRITLAGAIDPADSESEIVPGGFASNTTINSGGYLIVSSGATSTKIKENGGYVQVKDGADVTFMPNIISGLVLSNTTATVHSGTTANSATINPGGRFEVYSGGVASEVVENGGYVGIADGANISFASNTISGLVLGKTSATVHSGTTANSTTVNSGGDIRVFAGGTTNSTTVNSRGFFHVSSGGLASNITVNVMGRMNISSGGTANYTTVNSGGSTFVSIGGTASVTTVNSAGYLNVSSGGTATEIVENGGCVYVADGANVTFVPHTLSGLALLNSATVHSGTTMSDTIVGNGGDLTVFSGGTANGTMVIWSVLGVSMGGVANSTTVNDQGNLDVSSGGTANNTTVNADGRLDVSSGGTVNSTMVSYGNMYVFSEGTANSTMLLGSTIMKISSGGTANSIVVTSGGTLYVSSGGVALNIVEDGGYVSVGKDATVTFVPNTLSGLALLNYATVHSGTTAVDIAVIAGGLSLYSGGKLTGRVVLPKTNATSAESESIVDFDLTRIMPGAAARISNLSKLRGTPTYTITVNMDQADGLYALADNVNSFDRTITVLNSIGTELGTITVGETFTIADVSYTLTLTDSVLSLRIGEGNTPSPYTSDGLYISGLANSVSVQSGEVFHDTLVDMGKLYISSGGHAINTMVLRSLAHLHVSSGGMATHTTIDTNTSMSVSSGGTANDTIVNGGNFHIESHGFAENIVANSGTLHISSGGTALGIMENGGNVEVEDGATVTFIPNVLSGSLLGGTATIHSGTTASSIFIGRSDGRLVVSSGAVANDTTVAINRGLYVSVGGVANNTTVGGAAPRDASAVFDGTANNTTINYLGVVGVYDDGIVNSTTINSRGGLLLFGGTANITTVHSGGRMEVYSECSANSTTVNSGGSMYVHSGGTANSTTVSSGGSMIVSSGGTMTGQMMFEQNAIVSAFENAFLNFDISGLTTESGARVNNLAIIQGTPVYTLTVNGTEAEGVYTLAAGAKNFASTITVKNTYGDDLGTLKLGEKVYIGKDDYTLTLTDDVLSVAINAPTVTEANGDVLLESTMPKARYMYGCVNTSISMILGYYDLYGYRGKDLSEVIEGDVELDTRETGYYIYMMDDFDSVLGRANASRDYVERFFSKDPIEVINARTETETTPAEELPYSFVNDGAGPELRIDVWNCLADYLGTGQFWRGNKNLSATSPFDTLEAFLNDDTPYTVIDEATGIERTIDEKYNSCLYGLYLYVRDKGYDLDRKTTKILQADVAGGEFTFDDYRKEIDAGRPVMVLVTGHAMVGYGYNAETREIIIDNCYQSDQRMVWDGVYDFAGERTLEAICTFGFMTTDADIDLAVSPFDEDSGTAGKLIVATAEGQQESVDYCFVGSPLYLSFAVSNQGTTASGAFDIAIYCDGVKKDNIPSLTLDPEAIRRVYDIPLAADFGVGLHSIGVRIDPDNAIQELYALNNSDARSVMVLKEGTNVVEGTKTVASGGVSKDDYVMNGAGIQVLEGGTAEGTLIQGKVTSRSLDGKEVKYAPGFVNVSRGGLIRNATVYEYGQLELSGTAEDIRVQEEGSAVVSDGGIVSGVFVDKKGALAVESGGKLTGRIDVASGASVGFAEGGILNFDLTGTTAGAEAFVNDLSIIQGTPVYTLTVSSEQEEGVYALAEGAANFNNTISVVNKAGDKLGTLTVGGETVFVGGMGYTLNLTGSSLTVTVEEPAPSVPTNLVGTKDRVSWDPAGAGGYVVEYSTDDFAHALPVDTAGNAMDMLDLPAGTYQWRVKSDGGEDWAVGDGIVSDNDMTPKVLQSNADGSDDLFFAKADGAWEGLYYAQHVGSVNDWSGTNEVIFMNGRNRLADLFFGSDDANILCLTDDGNGDGIFVDDEFTDLPEGITEQQARIARIDEIRAGAGDDIVDMTSYRIEYTGDGLTVRGGDGNDTIWANKGDNLLFGDAGNDRIVGASGDDLIVGGIGDDRMHGGGGNDVFTFCGNFGMDEVQQLETGSVTLWFAEGSIDNWDEASLTYMDGENSVTVRGAASVNLKFGGAGEDAAQFAALSGLGAFDAFTSRRVFEETGKGILAGQ